MKITGNGIAFNYHIDGPTDAPWVTFTTGISNNISMWDAHIDVLARSYQLLRYDSRGHGESEATDGDYDFGLLVGDTVGLWDALGIDRSYLVGIGLGAMSAIELALAHAGRLRGLVACACRAELTPDYEGIWPPMIETAKNEGIEGIVERTSQRWFPDSFRENNPDVLERVRAMIRTTSLDGYLGCIGALRTLDIGRRVGDIDVPTLFISGALDHLGGPPEIMQSMCDAVANARHVTLADAGHICNIANPEAFTQALLAFLDAGVS